MRSECNRHRGSEATQGFRRLCDVPHTSVTRRPQVPWRDANQRARHRLAMPKRRLDTLLAERGLFESRTGRPLR